MAKRMPIGPLLQSIGNLLTNPTVHNVGRVGAGGAAGYYANDAYLNQVNPDVSDVGRMRSNLFGAVLGGTLASRGAMPALARAARKNDPRVALGGLGLAARYGFIVPSAEHAPFGVGYDTARLGLGLGQMLDPGKSSMPKTVATIKDPAKLDAALEQFSHPVQNASETLTGKAYDSAVSDVEKNKDQVAKWLKDKALPTTYGGIISALGGKPGEKPTLSDVGFAAVPHITGGAGGAYLGHLLGGGLGRFFFSDDPKADYEERRRQDQRRWWLQFLGANLGAVGGVYGAMNAAPHLNKLITKRSSSSSSSSNALEAEKTAAGPLFSGGRSRLLAQSLAQLFQSGAQRTGRAVTSLGKDTALAGALTAGQYASGIVPAGSFDREGNPIGLGPNANANFLLPLMGANLAMLKFTRGRQLLSGNKGFSGLLRGEANPIMRGLTLGAGATAAPSVVNIAGAAPPLFRAVLDPQKSEKFWGDFNKDTGNILGGAENFKPEDVAQSVVRGAQSALAKKPVAADALRVTKDVANAAEIPGVSQKGNETIRKMLGDTGISTLAQGVGMTSGGIAGLVGGDWLVDKLLTTAVRHKWIKNRKNLHQFLRDLGAVAGAGLGAYGGLQAMNYGVPAAAKYYNDHLAAKPKTAAAIRLPPAVDAARTTAIAAAVSGLLGAARGAVDPGYEEKFNRRGHIIAKVKRNPYMGALKAGLVGLVTGAGGSYVSQIANQYRPEINSWLQANVPGLTSRPAPPAPPVTPEVASA